MPAQDVRPNYGRRNGLSGSVLLTAFDCAPNAVGVCDEDGNFLDVNAAACRLLGFSRADMIGRPFLQFVHPADRSASLAAYFQSVVAAAAGMGVPAEHGRLRCLDRGGQTVWSTVRWAVTEPDSSGAQFGVVHMHDISGQQKVESELAEVEQRLSLAFHTSPIGIALVDGDGRMLQTNRELQELLGYAEPELQELNFLSVTHPDDRAATEAVFTQLAHGRLHVDDSVQRFQSSGGTLLYARRIAAAARTGDGELRYLLVQVEDITGEWRARAELRERAFRDALTGLSTREHLAAELALPRSARTLVVIAVRDLSLLNGTLGRAQTDQLVVALARRISAHCRHADVIARLGAAEFAVLLADDAAPADMVARRIAAALENPIATATGEVRLSIAIGTAADPTGELSLDDVLRQADLALHINKVSAAQPWTEFRPGMAADSARRLALEADLRPALDQGDISAEYQPVFNLADGGITSLEALARWTHPELGAISPAEFIPILEATGLIDQLTRHMLGLACRDVARWRQRHPERGLTVAVNISAHALSNPVLPALIADQLAKTGLPAEALVLEITETALATEHAHTAAATLSKLGVHLAIDDFGAEYSSLSRLAHLPADIIKLDRSLLPDPDDPTADAPVLRAVITLAGRLDKTLIAEGVESDTQLELLRRHGCPNAQGHHLARPQPAHDIDRLLERRPLLPRSAARLSDQAPS